MIAPDRRASRALVMQLVLRALLFGAAPYAASMLPFERIYTDGAYKAPHTEDPMFPVRAVLVAAGLLIPVLSACLTGITWRRRRTHPEHMLLQWGLLLSCAVVGWRNYPYWALGVYRSYVGDAPRGDFDPCALFPFTWIGPTWDIGVLLLYPIAVMVVPILVYSLLRDRKRLDARFALGGWASVAVTLYAFASTPSYMDWFMD